MSSSMTYPVCPLPPKPKRYRADTAGLSRETVLRLAKHFEDRSEWRKAAAYWQSVSAVQRDACLAIATSSELGDAWIAYRAGLAHATRSLTYRAFGLRWLIVNDCLHDHLVFAADADPVRDTALMQLLTDGMALTACEDDLLSHVIDAAGSLRGVEAVDRSQLVAKVVEALYVYGTMTEHFGSVEPDALAALVDPWVDVAIGLGHTPRECGAAREVVTLDGEGRELSAVGGAR